MKRSILAAALISLTSLAAAEQPERSTVEARLDALEKINVTAYKAPQGDEVKDAGVDAILARAAEAEQIDAAAE